jgi:hypothetical protein
VHGVAPDELDARRLRKMLPSLLGVLDGLRACDLAPTTTAALSRLIA